MFKPTHYAYIQPNPVYYFLLQTPKFVPLIFADMTLVWRLPPPSMDVIGYLRSGNSGGWGEHGNISLLGEGMAWEDQGVSVFVSLQYSESEAS